MYYNVCVPHKNQPQYQTNALFNYLIDYMEIEELKLNNEPKVILYVTMHLKLDGYAPKFALHEINKLPTKGKEKSKQFSSLENCLQNDGGEGGVCTICTTI